MTTKIAEMVQSITTSAPEVMKALSRSAESDESVVAGIRAALSAVADAYKDALASEEFGRLLLRAQVKFDKSRLGFQAANLARQRDGIAIQVWVDGSYYDTEERANMVDLIRKHGPEVARDALTAVLEGFHREAAKLASAPSRGT
jgi:hypothetical protein